MPLELSECERGLVDRSARLQAIEVVPFGQSVTRDTHDRCVFVCHLASMIQAQASSLVHDFACTFAMTNDDLLEIKYQICNIKFRARASSGGANEGV